MFVCCTRTHFRFSPGTFTRYKFRFLGVPTISSGTAVYHGKKKKEKDFFCNFKNNVSDYIPPEIRIFRGLKVTCFAYIRLRYLVLFFRLTFEIADHCPPSPSVFEGVFEKVRRTIASPLNRKSLRLRFVLSLTILNHRTKINFKLHISPIKYISLAGYRTSCVCIFFSYDCRLLKLR